MNHVVIIGWSGGDVDLPYLHEIIGRVNSNTPWTVYWHSDSDYKSLVNVFNKIERIDKQLLNFEHSDKFWNA